MSKAMPINMHVDFFSLMEQSSKLEDSISRMSHMQSLAKLIILLSVMFFAYSVYSIEVANAALMAGGLKMVLSATTAYIANSQIKLMKSQIQSNKELLSKLTVVPKHDLRYKLWQTSNTIEEKGKEYMRSVLSFRDYLTELDFELAKKM